MWALAGRTKLLSSNSTRARSKQFYASYLYLVVCIATRDLRVTHARLYTRIIRCHAYIAQRTTECEHQQTVQGVTGPVVCIMQDYCATIFIMLDRFGPSYSMHEDEDDNQSTRKVFILLGSYLVGGGRLYNIRGKLKEDLQRRIMGYAFYLGILAELSWLHRT